jgi:hypothetical protein
MLGWDSRGMSLDWFMCDEITLNSRKSQKICIANLLVISC